MVWAVTPALGAAFCFALAAALQQRAAASAPGRDAPVAVATYLLRQRGWLVGTAAGMVGVGLQVAALSLGPIALVQPVTVMTLLFALPVGAMLHGRRVAPAEFLAGSAVVVGLAGLLLTLDTATGPPVLTGSRLALLVFLAGGSFVLLAVLAARLGGVARTLLFAGAAGTGFGVTAALVHVLSERVADHGLLAAAGWTLVATAAVSFAGLAFSQAAYGSGRLPAALATILVMEPTVAVGVGALLLREPVSAGRPVLVAAEVALIVGGVSALAWLTQTGAVTPASDGPREVAPGLRGAA